MMVCIDLPSSDLEQIIIDVELTKTHRQENSAQPCDTGSPISLMSKEWPDFDWSVVDPAYPSKEGLYAYSKSGLRNRGLEARYLSPSLYLTPSDSAQYVNVNSKWLHSRPEKVIAVVSHSGFLRVGVSARKYDNADFRVFDFQSSDEARVGSPSLDGVRVKEYELIEWELTEKKGGGLGRSPKGVYKEGDDDDYIPETVGEVVGEKPGWGAGEGGKM
jgi:hypothetical protein